MSPPWMPLYIADFLGDTSHLDDAETGAYILLIMHYWTAGGLPDDDKKLSRIARSTPRRWLGMRPTIQAFFHDGWRHKRIDAELSHAADVIEKRRAAVAQRENKRKSNDASSDLSNDAHVIDHTSIQPPSPKEEERKVPTTSAADAPRDVRADLFARGLTVLVQITGKTPDSARSLIGRWLKDVQDEAIHVLAAIENAERNRIADPVAWINRALKPHERNGHGKRTVHDAAHDLVERLRSFDEPAPSDLREREGGNPVRLLPSGRRQ